MNDSEYILIKQKERFWPAKILSRVCASRTRQAHRDATYLVVEILGLNKQASVPREVAEVLTKESIELIAADLGQSRKGCDNVEEITYRRALREALDILNQATPSEGRSPTKTAGSQAAAWKKTKEPSPLTRTAGRRLPSSQNEMQKGEGKTSKASAAPQTVGPRNQRSLFSGRATEESSSARSPAPESRNGELEGQPRRSLRAKTPVMPQKGVTLKSLSRPGASRRSPHFSKGSERHHQDKASQDRSSPSSTSKYLTRTSTPARSSHNCAKSTPGQKPGGKLRLRRSLLGPPVKCPSAEAEKDLSEKEEFLPRKYSKDLDGQRNPQDSEGAGQRQTPVVSSACQEKRCASHDKASACSPDLPGPVLDGIQKESPCAFADEAKNVALCDLEGKGLGSPSEPALRLSPIREICLSSAFEDEEEAEDEELPSILLHQEPCMMKAGMLVWCKLRKYPYWPAVVKSVKRKAKKASVQFIDKCMDDKKSKGFFISLRNLKHFDCEEKQMLIDKARERYQDEINWCVNLIADYRIRVGCHSFTGSFLEYCADDMSYPVRKETHHNLSQMTFPQKEEVDSEEPPPEVQRGLPTSQSPKRGPPREATPTKTAKKVLPDRTRAARDKANKKIVEFIVKAQGADEHLRAILESKKPSRWLERFLNAPPYLTPIETYLEDDNQQDLVVKYLQEIYQEVGAELLPLINGDSLKFILDVLFPEAIICAISAVDQIDYKKAEEKYIRGPLQGQRERETFEEELKKRKQRLPPSPEEAS